MEPFDSIIDAALTSIGAPPGSYRWEIITACSGWGAAIALTIALGLSVFGQASLSGYGFATFNFLVWIALKRDIKKLFQSKKLEKYKNGK